MEYLVSHLKDFKTFASMSRYTGYSVMRIQKYLKDNNVKFKSSRIIIKDPIEWKNEVEESTNGEYIGGLDFINVHKKVKIIHKKCGKEYMCTPTRFREGDRCPTCMAHNSQFNEETRCKENKDIKEKLGEDYVLIRGIQTNINNKIKIYHKKCGKTYEVKANHILYDDAKCSCIAFNSNSKGEKYISEWLKKNNFDFECHVTDFPFNKGLPQKKHFDFKVYLDNKFVLIEFDGSLHFEPRGNSNKSIEKLKLIQKNDKFKTNYCIENDIPLLRIKNHKSSFPKSMQHIIDEKLENFLNI